MEWLIIGGLCATAFVAATLLWHLQTSPGAVLALFDPKSSEIPERSSLRGLRLVLGLVVLGAGFATGAAAAFLTATR